MPTAEQSSEFLLNYKGPADESLMTYVNTVDAQVAELGSRPPGKQDSLPYLAENEDLTGVKLATLDAEIGELEGTLRPRLLAARGKSPAAFARRCIPLSRVVHRSNTTGILPLLALLSARIADLGATRGFTTDC